MKPLRLALFVILLIFHAILVILSLNFSQSIADSIVRNPTAFRFLVFFGLLVFLITFTFAWFDRRTARKQIEKLEAEKNAIKADVFDREQRTKKREQEIEQEIKSFEKSLPSAQPTVTKPVLPEHSEEPDSPAPPAAEPYSTELRSDESYLTDSEATQSQPIDPDQVEYGPLTPKRPIPDEDIDTDDNSARS